MQSIRLAVGCLLVSTTVLSPGSAAASTEVRMARLQFTPKEVTVPVGDTVQWTHADGSKSHTVTADDGSFESSPTCSSPGAPGCMTEGSTFSHTFSGAGRFPYHCRIHGGPGGEAMSGVVVVQ
jgi:plastocyanin